MRRAILKLILRRNNTDVYSGDLAVYIKEQVDDSDIQYIKALGTMTAWLQAYGDNLTMIIKVGIDPIIEEQLHYSEQDFLKMWSYVYTETQQRVTEYLNYTPVNAVFKGKEVTI